MLEARRRVLVDPFYLKMMGINAIGADDELTSRVAKVAADLPVAEIIELLQSDWRPRVMGAWYAAARTDPALPAAILASLTTCLGSLTAPPLVTAALVHVAPSTLSELVAYQERDASNQWGSAGIAAAAIERLGGSGPEPADRDRDRLSDLLAVAARVRRG